MEENDDWFLLEAIRRGGFCNTLPSDGAARCEALAALRHAVLEKAGFSAKSKLPSTFGTLTSTSALSSSSAATSSRTQTSVDVSRVSSDTLGYIASARQRGGLFVPPGLETGELHVDQNVQNLLSVPWLDEEDEDWLLLEVIKTADLGEVFAKSGALQRRPLKALRLALLVEVETILQRGIATDQQSYGRGSSHHPIQTRKPQHSASAAARPTPEIGAVDRPARVRTSKGWLQRENPPTPGPPRTRMVKQETLLGPEITTSDLSIAGQRLHLRPSVARTSPIERAPPQDPRMSFETPGALLRRTIEMAAPSMASGSDSFCHQSPAAGSVPLPHNIDTDTSNHHDLEDPQDSSDLQMVRLSL